MKKKSKKIRKMSFRFITSNNYDNVTRYIKSIRFDISRYGVHSFVIDFLDEDKTELEAVQAAEEFLSRELTREFFELVKDDVFSESFNDYKIIGDLLGDGAFYEGLTKESEGKYYINHIT